MDKFDMFWPISDEEIKEKKINVNESRMSFVEREDLLNTKTSENKVKQVIVMRTDLNMRKGKMIAQGAHASIAFLTSRITILEQFDPHEYVLDDDFVVSAAEKDWLEGRFTKICVRVDSEEELLEIHARATEAGVVSHLIQDAGLTEFKDAAGNPLPTYTCLGLGPDYEDRINPITGNLQLL